jgi:hypothetical protein
MTKNTLNLTRICLRRNDGENTRRGEFSGFSFSHAQTDIQRQGVLSLQSALCPEASVAGVLLVSTVGLDEESVRNYIRDQEAKDARLEQLNMLHNETPPSEVHDHSPLGASKNMPPALPGVI